MTSAWLLPEHIADVLPSQSRQIEELRRQMLDSARSYGYELVIPPLIEHLESLLSGTGHELDLRTFKLVDQSSGRTLGLRADTTPQVARIDAHLLNRDSVTRLCYCGPVVHARPAGLRATREPLQFGAELYGHSGLEADLEIQDLALDCLHAAGVGGLLLDLADARIVRSLLSGVAADSNELMAVYDALAAKDAEAVSRRTQGFPDEARRGLLALTSLYGDVDVLAAAEDVLPSRPPIRAALSDLRRLAEHATAAHPAVQVGFDLADFAVYATGCSDSLVRGGRYDEVGAVFGRNRPAVGFSTDLKQLPVQAAPKRHAAVLAPWSEEADLRAAVRKLRATGETVVCVLPGREDEVQEFDCDREIVAIDGRWVVRAR